ncbi:MAG: DUF115 domain-containing protein [Planctomycetes bacterium]|nr:DUF115 domain-containing protein [Planctomycetota bacterium]
MSEPTNLNLPPLLAKNFAVIKNRDMRMFERIATAPDDLEVRPADTKAIDPRTNLPAPSLEVLDQRSGKWVRLHSIQPFVEAQRRVTQIDTEATKNWLVCGFGLGYHVEEVLKKLGNTNFNVLCVEASPTIFRQALASRDLTHVLGDQRVRIFVGGQVQEFSEWLFYTFGEIIVDDITVHKHAPSERLFTEFYNRCIQETESAINRFEVNVLTAEHHGKTFFKNMLKNALFQIDAGDPRALKDLFKGRPIVCVAAGPSLDRNIHLLREAQEKCVVIAVDSSLKPLMKNGIVPDMVALIDPIDTKLPALERYPYQDQTALLAVQHCSPNLIAAWGGPRFLAQSNAPVSSWAGKHLGDYLFLGECLTVAHAAFFVAAHMGGDPIIFLGQDLGFPQSLSHTHSTHTGDAWGSGVSLATTMKTEKDALVYIPGVDGLPVPTFRNMAAFAKTYETEIHKLGVHCIDATEGGAFIQGTVVSTLWETILNFFRESFPKKEAIARACEPVYRPERVQKLRDEAKRYLGNLVTMKRDCKRGQEAAKEMITLLDAENALERIKSDKKFHDRYHKFAEAIIKADAACFKQDPDFTEVVSQILVRTRINVKRWDDKIRYAENEDQRQKTQAGKYAEVFRDYYELSDFLIEQFSEFVASLDEIIDVYVKRGA